jgi:hypothetical protein
MLHTDARGRHDGVAEMTVLAAVKKAHLLAPQFHDLGETTG